MNELVVGAFLPETKPGLLRIIQRMETEKNVDSVILAGTEIANHPGRSGVRRNLDH